MMHNSEMPNSRKRTAREEWHHMQNKRNDFGAPSHQEASQPHGIAPPAFQHPMVQQEPMATGPIAEFAPLELQNPMVQPEPARPLGEIPMNQQQKNLQRTQLAQHQHHNGMQYEKMENQPPMINPQMNQYQMMPNSQMNHQNPMPKLEMDHHIPMQNSQTMQNSTNEYIPSDQLQYEQPDGQFYQPDYHQDSFMQHPNHQMYPQNYGAPTEQTCLNSNLDFQPSSSAVTLESSLDVPAQQIGESSENAGPCTIVNEVKTKKRRTVKKVVDKDAVRLEIMTHNIDSGDNIVDYVVGRLTSVGYVKKFNLRADEIWRRVNYPEYMNLSAVACIFRKAKVKGGGPMMRQMLEKDFGIVVKKCQREGLRHTKFSCLVEEEALQIAEDFHEAAATDFPKTAIGAHIADEAAQSYASEDVLNMMNSFARIIGAVKDVAAEVQPKVSGKVEYMCDDDKINNEITSMSLRTHGFAVENQNTALIGMMGIVTVSHEIAYKTHESYEIEAARSFMANHPPLNYYQYAVPPYPNISNH